MELAVKEKINNSPFEAGVYFMKDALGKIIYVGKAKSLRKRLKSYLGSGLSGKALAMMNNVAAVDYSVCPNESMALLLEAGLIRKYKPKYNISLRDDKSFPWVKFTNEDFPQIIVTRRKENDGARYLGPYTSAKLLRQALKIIRRSFPFRSCRNLPSKACMYFKVGLCRAPCAAKPSIRDYQKDLGAIAMILEGRTEALIGKLSKKMLKYSRKNSFEEAAVLRDQINALSSLGAVRIGVDSDGGSEGLRRILGLKKMPRRIEAFDISNISGKQATGSMASFLDGHPDKNNYRKFRIKTVESVDDYAMMREVVFRRYSRLKRGNLGFPDLILIDGGRGHLSSAQEILRSLGLKIPIAGIAKQEEDIYLLSRSSPIKLSADNPALTLLRRVRDEAHRFAVSYHRLLRRKNMLDKPKCQMPKSKSIV